MIDISNAPRWIKEIYQFYQVKHLIFLQGNCLDMVYYGIQTGEHQYWTESHLTDFLNRFFIEQSYEIIINLDFLNGISFPSQTARERFEAVQKEQRNKPFPFNGASNKGRRQSQDAAGELLTLMDQVVPVLYNNEHPSVVILGDCSRWISDPQHLQPSEQALFTMIQRTSLHAPEVILENKRFRNLIIMTCDKLNDLPPFLYLKNPRSRAITIDKPGNNERIRFIQERYGQFYQLAETEEPDDSFCGHFSALTDGLTHYELLSLISLSHVEKLPLSKIESICERFKYGIKESEWEHLNQARLESAESLMRSKVKGQDEAIHKTLEVIKRARVGLESGSVKSSLRPRGVLFFAGPTGVGKTELAKTLAEIIFGDRERLCRFDMSEYAQPHSDQKLMGAPPGYVGFEDGGKLTNSVKSQPFSVLLFDEIEKAHPSIFDKFLQILDDGRLTDGKGDTVYFSECLLIFTSNLGAMKVNERTRQREMLIDPAMPYRDVKSIILSSIHDYFAIDLGRPEILNRFGDNFVVFDFIRSPVDRMILEYFIQQLKEAMKQRNQVELEVESACLDAFLKLFDSRRAFGGRGIRNLVESALINPISELIFSQAVSAGNKLIVSNLLISSAETKGVDKQVTSNSYVNTETELKWRVEEG